MEIRGLRSTWRILFLLCFVAASGAVSVYSQCPDTGETKVTKPAEGTGFNFFELLGDSSFRYFLDGSKFSMNDKADPGKTFLFIDGIAYEPLLLEKAQLQEYTKSRDDVDILRAQAKYEQGYFKKADPTMRITDYGSAYRRNPDGSPERAFYLWKKESAAGKTPATQYLVSTIVKERLFVMSLMVNDASLSEDDVMRQIQSYTSHFAMMSGSQCARVLGAPPQP